MDRFEQVYLTALDNRNDILRRIAPVETTLGLAKLYNSNVEATEEALCELEFELDLASSILAAARGAWITLRTRRAENEVSALERLLETAPDEDKAHVEKALGMARVELHAVKVWRGGLK